jgi:hypothetical protein
MYRSFSHWVDGGELIYMCMYDHDDIDIAPVVSENDTCDEWEEDK